MARHSLSSVSAQFELNVSALLDKRMHPVSTTNANQPITSLFEGKKSKWLPLYRRLLARLSGIPGIGFFPIKNRIAIGYPDHYKATMGMIRVTPSGLDVALGLSKGFSKSERLRPCSRSPKWLTHHVTVAQASDIDEEFLSWMRAAKLQARTSRPKST